MKLVRLGFVIAVLVCASSAFALDSSVVYRFSAYQDLDFEFSGGGARAQGMGNAHLGVADDINAVGWNPAGLYLIEKPIVTGTWNSVSPKGSSQLRVGTPSPRFDAHGSIASLSALSFVAPVRVKGHQFVCAIGHTRTHNDIQNYRVTDEAIDSAIVYFPRRDTLPTPTMFDVEWGVLGGLYATNIGFGTRLYNEHSFGFTINIYSGTSVASTNYVQLASDYPISIIGDPIFGKMLFKRESLDSARFSGVNFTFGYKMKKENFALGVVIRTPFELKATRTTKLEDSTFFQYDPGNFGLFSSNIYYMVNEATKYKLPVRIGAGFSWQTSERLLLALDAEYQGFSGGSILMRDSIVLDPGGENLEYYREIDPAWSDVFTVRTGLEYVYPTGIGDIPLRAGFGYIPRPGPSVKLDDRWQSSYSTVTVKRFTLGLGLHWSQIKLDWSYAYSTAKQDVASLAGYGSFLNLSAVEGDTEQVNHQFGMSFTGHF